MEKLIRKILCRHAWPQKQGRGKKRGKNPLWKNTQSAWYIIIIIKKSSLQKSIPYGQYYFL